MNILDKLETMYKKDKYSLDIVQLRTLVDYLFFQIEEEQNKNVDFCSEWLHKSKLRKLLNDEKHLKIYNDKYKAAYYGLLEDIEDILEGIKNENKM